MARVTLQTVADKVGVSRMTVSNAFSRPDQLSAPLRRKILDAAAELGYAGPDPAARALARGTTGAVGVLLTASLRYAFTDPVAVEFLGAVAEELSSTGLALTLLTTESRNGVLPARDVALDGALVYSCTPSSESVDWLLKRGVPVVFVDQDVRDDLSAVNVDDRAGARAAAEHVVAQGHRHIALMTLGIDGDHGLVTDLATAAPTWLRVGRDRALGTLDVLAPLGIEPVAYRQAENTENAAREAARLLLALDPAPTAFLCYSDVQARGVLLAAGDLGLDVPGDLSVVGYDDGPLAVAARPALTTVRQDVEAKGRGAATALVEAMDARRAGREPDVSHRLLPTRLVVRDSVGPAPRPGASR